jgi:uncharacterized protein (TIGR02246 family)
MQRPRSLVPFVVAIAVFAVAGTPTWAASTQEESIRQIIAEHNAAWNVGDAVAWTKDFADDADFINILGTHYQGKEETRQRHAELFSTIFKGSEVRVDVWKVRFVGSSGAVVETTHELRGFSRLPPGIRPTLEGEILKTRMKYVFETQAGKWVIVSAQNTAIAPRP